MTKKITFESLEELAADQPKLVIGRVYLWLAQMSQTRVAVLLHELFEQLDDTLFSMAESSKGERDSIHSIGLREIRRMRPRMVDCFFGQLARDIGSFEEIGSILAPCEVDPENGEAEPRPLKPCSNSAMRAFGEMKTRAETRSFRSLNELNQHLGDLRSSGPSTLEQNPLSPGNLCRCFQYAMNLMTVDEVVELTTCEMFDRYVISQMQFVLDHVNTELRRVAKLKDSKKLADTQPGQLTNLFASVKSLLATKRAQDQSKVLTEHITGEQQAVDQAKPVKPVKPVKAAKAAKPSKPVKPAEPAKPSKPLTPAVEMVEIKPPKRVVTPVKQADPEPVIERQDDPFLETPSQEKVDHSADDALEIVFAEDSSDAIPEDDEFLMELHDDPPIADAIAEADAIVEVEEIAAAIPPVEALPPLPVLAEGETHAIQTIDILAVLADMQRDDEVPDIADIGESPVSQKLMAGLRARRPEYEDAEFNEEDEGTVDLVDLVFDFVLHDHNLPGPLQAMLAQLQVPYLRVALLDWQLFALSEHPARKLLDELARAAQGWSEVTDVDFEIYRRVEIITRRIMDDLAGNQALYSQLLDSFGRFMTHFEQRARDSEQKALTALRERERLNALKQSTAAIRERMVDGKIPDLIDELLRRTMPELLIAHWLDHGIDSRPWRESLELVDHLVAVCHPRETADAVAELESLLPQLVYRLNLGFDVLGYDRRKKTHIFSELDTVLRDQVAMEFAGDLNVPADPSAPVEEPQVAAQRSEADLEFDEAAQLILGVEPGEGDEALTAESLHEALAGSWFEFNREGFQPMRAKLSWAMPVGAKYLFVDQTGQEVAEKTLSELAAAIKSGEATILESIPLFERALAAIAERLLKDSHSKTGTH